MENSLMRMMTKGAWLLTALASIHLGVVALFGAEYDMMRYVPEALFKPLMVLYLVAGLYSFVMLFMHCACSDCKC